ncbi:MAG TPA: alginate export family protein [Phycisphaerae bacterium]|nr:alginate export family protein [Phycisphaerae bacterium]HRW54770.1 alginate export family protein [Phycisphaerae bacterium]
MAAQRNYDDSGARTGRSHHARARTTLAFIAIAGGFMSTPGLANDASAGVASRTTEESAGVAPHIENGATSEPLSLRKQYATTRSVAAAPHRDLPTYVHTYSLGERGDNWFDFGLEQRTRFEIRDDFYAKSLASDDRFLMRTRGYLGVRSALDPLRFGVEFQDSRRLGGELNIEDTGDINENELLQLFAELYFADAVAPGHPVSIRFGRMSYDTIDRRLVARNRFRNTTNAFDGLRVRIGDDMTPWEIEAFAYQPVERFIRSFDHGDDERWFYGLTGAWRGWSPWVTLEPYYFVLDEDRKAYSAIDREIHTLGLHGFGLIGDSGFDYDFNVAYQFGNVTRGKHRAFATHAELGYTFDTEWTPRAAFMFDYASGDENPNDGVNERFDRLFGAAHNFYGHSDNVILSNLIQAALHLSAKPSKKLKLNAFYRNFWLASDRDAFVSARISDPLGQSGDWVGHEIDLRAQYALSGEVGLDLGFSHFMPGAFTSHAGGASVDDSDFFYVQITITPKFE